MRPAHICFTTCQTLNYMHEFRLTINKTVL